jgi:hypothetical protein
VKRLIAVTALAALVATPALSHAAPKKPKRVERTVTFAYTGACQAGVGDTNAGVAGCPNELNEIARTGEAYVKFSAKDSTGQVIGLIAYNTDDFASDNSAHCGGITKARKIKPKTPLSVATMADPSCGGLPTTGTITMVFSNLP